MKTKTLCLIAVLTFIAFASFAQSKKDMEADLARCTSAKDSILVRHAELTATYDALVKSFDSLKNISVAYDTMYAVVKEKVFHQDFPPDKIGALIDSLHASRDNAFMNLSSSTGDSIAVLNKKIVDLMAQMGSLDAKTQIINDLKKLKELLDAQIITQQEFDTKKTALLEKF
jgi:hypothetical protein